MKRDWKGWTGTEEGKFRGTTHVDGVDQVLEIQRYLTTQTNFRSQRLHSIHPRLEKKKIYRQSLVGRLAMFPKEQWQFWFRT